MKTKSLPSSSMALWLMVTVIGILFLKDKQYFWGIFALAVSIIAAIFTILKFVKSLDKQKNKEIE